MINRKELENTSKLTELKFNEILNSTSGTDADYIKNLQTLITLKNAADQKLDNKEYI